MAFRKVSTDNLVCSPCSRLGVNNDATHWCKNCTEYICKECFMSHKKIQQLSDHELKKLDFVTDNYFHVEYPPQEVFCCLHTDEIATGFSIRDKKPYCFDCLKSMDMKFNEVIKVEQLVNNLDSTMLDRDVSCLHIISDILKKSLHCIKDEESDFNKSVEGILQSVQQLASETKEYIDELVMKTNTYFNELSDMEQKQSVKQKQELSSFINFLELRIILLKSKTLSSKEIFALSLKTKQELCTKSESLRNTLEQSELHVLKFEPNRMFQHLKALKSFGEIQKQPKPSTALEEFKQINEQIHLLQKGLFPGSCAQVEVVSIKQTDSQLAKTVKDTQDKNVTVRETRTEMIIKCTDINTRRLYDSGYLPDGRIVVTDWDRNKLFLFDDSITLQAQYDVKISPRGVCVSADGSLIYVMHEDGTLVIYRLQGGLRKESRIKVQRSTTGVGMSGDTIISGKFDTVILYSMDGTELSCISKEGGYDTYICVSQDGSRFYHKDNNNIVCRSVSDLSEIFRYSHPELLDPYGITCERHGNILVAGWLSNNIIMIDKDGTQGRVLVDKLHGIRHPSGVCCHPQRDEFVVVSFDMQYGGNDNAMEVYEIK